MGYKIEVIYYQLKYFFRNQNATFTKIIKAGTSTNGPITPAKAWPLLIPNTPIEIAIANSKLIFVENAAIALDLINEYGPEHFIVCTENDDYYVDNIANAGSVFIGNYTPESAGDYASGTNHTLPTNGYAKNYSGVNLDSFMKSMTFQKISETGILSIGKAIEIMAEKEGLQAHKNAVTLRLNAIENGK